MAGSPGRSTRAAGSRESHDDELAGGGGAAIELTAVSFELESAPRGAARGAQPARAPPNAADLELMNAIADELLAPVPGGQVAVRPPVCSPSDGGGGGGGLKQQVPDASLRAALARTLARWPVLLFVAVLLVYTLFIDEIVLAGSRTVTRSANRGRLTALALTVIAALLLASETAVAALAFGRGYFFSLMGALDVLALVSFLPDVVHCIGGVEFIDQAVHRHVSGFGTRARAALAVARVVRVARLGRLVRLIHHDSVAWAVRWPTSAPPARASHLAYVAVAGGDMPVRRHAARQGALLGALVVALAALVQIFIAFRFASVEPIATRAALSVFDAAVPLAAREPTGGVRPAELARMIAAFVGGSTAELWALQAQGAWFAGSAGSKYALYEVYLAGVDSGSGGLGPGTALWLDISADVHANAGWQMGFLVLMCLAVTAAALVPLLGARALARGTVDLTAAAARGALAARLDWVAPGVGTQPARAEELDADPLAGLDADCDELSSAVERLADSRSTTALRLARALLDSLRLRVQLELAAGGSVLFDPTLSGHSLRAGFYGEQPRAAASRRLDATLLDALVAGRVVDSLPALVALIADGPPAGASEASFARLLDSVACAAMCGARVDSAEWVRYAIARFCDADQPAGQRGALGLLAHWLRLTSGDVLWRSAEVRGLVIPFLCVAVPATDSRALGHQLRASLASELRAFSAAFATLPQPMMPPERLPSATDLVRVHALAEELAAVARVLWSRVTAGDLVGDSGAGSAMGVRALVAHERRIECWLQLAVIGTHVAERVSALEAALALAEHAVTLGDALTAATVTGALSAEPVARLRDTWAAARGARERLAVLTRHFARGTTFAELYAGYARLAVSVPSAAIMLDELAVLCSELGRIEASSGGCCPVALYERLGDALARLARTRTAASFDQDALARVASRWSVVGLAESVNAPVNSALVHRRSRQAEPE